MNTLPVVFEYLLLFFYLVPASVLILFACNLYVLLFFFRKSRTQVSMKLEAVAADFETTPLDQRTPSVVVQIPVYNEYNVIENCMRAAAKLDYPHDKLLIQLLDDSTDNTVQLIDQIAEELKREGCRVQVVRRSDRTGFKAGALEYGMEQAEADAYAIFDADFIPPPDFLQRTIPVLVTRPEVGLVQARWGHANRSSNALTRAQGIGIDGHFTVEQSARAWNGLFMNFNGTAGLWRRQAIEEAGGWEHDTLTEDMDLSYRAQLVGWKPWFIWDLEVPAEIPEDIDAFKSQQFRWAKGSIETAVKLLPRILGSTVKPKVKVQAFFHLTHYIVHPMMLWLALLTFPVLMLTRLGQHEITFGILIAFILLSTLAPSSMYAVSQLALYGKSGLKRLWLIPVLSFLGIGISLSNTRAVFQALAGKKSAFIRTPKKGDRGVVNYQVHMPWLGIFELCMGVYCCFSFYRYMQMDRVFAVPFILLYALGFTSVGFLSLKESMGARWKKQKVQSVAG